MNALHVTIAGEPGVLEHAPLIRTRKVYVYVRTDQTTCSASEASGSMPLPVDLLRGRMPGFAAINTTGSDASAMMVFSLS